MTLRPIAGAPCDAPIPPFPGMHDPGEAPAKPTYYERGTAAPTPSAEAAKPRLVPFFHWGGYPALMLELRPWRSHHRHDCLFLLTPARHDKPFLLAFSLDQLRAAFRRAKDGPQATLIGSSGDPALHYALRLAHRPTNDTGIFELERSLLRPGPRARTITDMAFENAVAEEFSKLFEAVMREPAP